MSYLTLRKYSYGHHDVVDAEYERRFHDHAAHHIDFDVAGHPAFFIATEQINKTVVGIYKADKRVCLLSAELPRRAMGQYLLKCLIDEIKLSNDIEGVVSTRKEIGSAYIGIRAGRSRRFAGIVNKYTMLWEKTDIPLSTCMDIRTVYDDLVLNEVRGADPQNVPDGEIFRKGTVSIRSKRQEIVHEGLYPESRIIEAMEKALAYLHDETEEALFRIAVFHYLFGYIHPFYDGNGRMDRFISSYMLTRSFEPALGYRLSYAIRNKLEDYYNEFKECGSKRNRGELTSFVEFFLGVILTAVTGLEAALEDCLTKWRFYIRCVESLSASADEDLCEMCKALVQAALFSENGASVRELAAQLEKSDTTVRKYLKEVDDLGLLSTSKMGREIYYGMDLERLADSMPMIPRADL